MKTLVEPWFFNIPIPMHVPEERNMDLLISLREHIGMGMFQGFLIVKLVSFFFTEETHMNMVWLC